MYSLTQTLRKKFLGLVFVLTLFLSLPAVQQIEAQCPMCRANVEAARNRGIAVGNGLNTGILYLLASPYILVGTVGVFWYFHSRKQRKLREAQANAAD